MGVETVPSPRSSLLLSVCISLVPSLFKVMFWVENKEPKCFYFVVVGQLHTGTFNLLTLTFNLFQWPPFGYHTEWYKLDYFPFWKQNKKRKKNINKYQHRFFLMFRESIITFYPLMSKGYFFLLLRINEKKI